MDRDAGAIDEQLVGHPVSTGQNAEDAFPYTALGPPHEAAVERILGAIDRWAVAPPAAALQRMDNP